MSLNVVLVEPEIPQNTGNISRTCAATSTKLHLVKPLGFVIDDAKLRRAGLDYWHLLDITYYDDLEDFFRKHADKRLWYCSTKASLSYSSINYNDDDFLVFGKETKGLPEELVYNNLQSSVRIPMIDGARSLNLSNSVAVVLYEALRQLDFLQMKG